MSSGLIARITARVHAEFPGIELVLSEGILLRQWNAIQVGEVDIGLGIPPSSAYSDLASETVDHNIFDAVLVSSDDALATRAHVSIHDVQDRTFLSYRSRIVPEYERQQKAAFARIGFKPAKTREFEDLYSIVALVAAGQGWALFPTSTMPLATTGTSVVPLSDFRMLLPLAVISRRDESRPVVHTVLSVIRQLTSAERAAEEHVAGEEPDRVSEWLPGDDAVDDTAIGERSIELRHLRYFSAVVEAKSFGRAAERLELTQPALSRQIRDLEQSIGVALLARATRGVSATAAGESFFRSTRRILDEADALPAEAQRARRGMVSRCVIAAVGTPGARTFLSEMLRRCGTEQPQIEVFVEDYHTPLQPPALRAARVDLGLCHASPMSSVDERGLRRDHLVHDVVNCALVPADSALAQRASIDFHDLANTPFIFPERAFQPLLYDQLFSIFERHAYVPRIEQTFDGLKTAWTMVAEGRGWAIGFQSQRSDPPVGTVAVPVNGFAMPWGLDVLSREDESRTSILLVLDMLLDIARLNEAPRTVA